MDDVDGGHHLDQLAQVISRFVALPREAVTAAALWVFHTYALAAAFVSPILALTSPVKRCGKSTLLTVLSFLSRRPLVASNVTPAALFRTVESYHPTLLVDEADTFIRRSDELRGVINSGHTRATAFVVRIVGKDHEPRRFSTWAPKAIALIGRPPATIEDRSIVVRMRRKAPGERVERLRLDRMDDLEELRSRSARWSEDHEVELRGADPEVPPGLHDRAADNWRPLLAIADVAGGEWPARAREAARVLSAAAVEDDEGAAGIQLLGDLRELFDATPRESFFTEELLTSLHEREDRPWAEWRQDRPLSGVQLARLLKPFRVEEGVRVPDFPGRLPALPPI